MKRDIQVVQDLEAVARGALTQLRRLLDSSPEGPFRIALSGGSTPRRLYELMAEASLPWERIHLFWGDERCVPPDHKDSNYRMTREAMLDRLKLPDAQVHRWQAELDPDEAARLYDKTLKTEFGADWPQFDLMWLGMGEDGHTASLFPGSPALERTDVAAVANYIEKFENHRLTLTFPAINASRHVALLISGAGKAPVLPEALHSDHYPVSRVHGTSSTLFLLDQAAAAQLG